MIPQAVRMLLLAGLLILPAVVSAAMGTPGLTVLSNHGPVNCGPGPEC
jgi:hypothetical protein